MNEPSSPHVHVRDRTFLFVVCALALLLALSLPPPSSSRIQTWPLALGAAAFWLLPILVAAIRFARGRPDARLGGALDAALALFAVGGLVSAAFSPLRETLAPHLLPFLGALSLPYALLPILRKPRTDLLAGAFLYPLILAGVFLWLPKAGSRNDQPFGHANTTGAVFALAACWLAGMAVATPSRRLRALHIFGSASAAALAASSGSRGAVLALAAAAATGGALVFFRRGRIVPFFALTVLAFSVAIFSNQRLRELVASGGWSAVSNESNAQRIAMIRGGLELGRLRPLVGWGPGAVPHVFPSVRANLPGIPDNYLQLHNSLAQATATLGLPGLLGIFILLLATVRRALSASATPDRAPILAALVCGAVLLLFDHSFATPAFAVLAALPVAALAHAGRPPAPRPRLWLFVIVGPLLALLAWPVGRDLAARAAWASALDAANEGAAGPYAAELRRAHELAPADLFFSDQLASHLAIGHPFPAPGPAPSPEEAISILRSTLARNPAHEFARYNLGWLLLAEPAAEPAEIEKHFASAARLAPARAGVWLGLALARLQAGATDSAIPALAAEVLLDPAFAWSPHWREPALLALRPAVLACAADFLDARRSAPEFAARLRNPGAPVDAASVHRRVRAGHGVLYGHPDGRPPADVPVLLNVNPPFAPPAALPPKGFVPPVLLLACGGLAA